MLEYRKATADEAGHLAKIRMDFLIEVNNITEEEKEMMYINCKEFLFTALSDGTFVSWVAVENTQIIATSGITFYRLPPNQHCPSGKAAYVSDIFTYPMYRNQGIASKLLNLIIGEARQKGHTKVLLNATDAGKNIYIKYGFTEVKNDMVYYITSDDTTFR